MQKLGWNLPLPVPRCYLRFMPKISHFECSRCKKKVPADKPQTLCPDCAGSLYVRYDLSGARGTARRDAIDARRRLDADAAQQALPKCLFERRRRESDGKF